MQRNANVGSKLLALIAVPAIVLVAVASLGARQRLDDAAQAQSTENAARLAAASAELAHQLQLERMLSMRVVNGDDSVSGALDEQRGATDDASEAFSVTEVSGDGTVARRYEAVNGQVETIVALRDSIDGANAAPDVTLDAYTEAIASVVDLEATLASQGGDPKLSVALGDTLTLGRAKEARAEASARIAGIATVGAFQTGDYQALSALEDEEARQTARLEESQNTEFATALRNAMATPEVRDADALLDAVMSEGVIGGSGTPGVAADTWTETATGWLQAARSVESDALSRTISVADTTAFDAHKSARLYLIGTAAAVILSLLLATLLARRINRRLQKLTVAANRLATEELPRLVEDLRSPGDAAAEHEPIAPLEVDSGDEIGQLAEAFNAIQQVTSQVAEEQAALLRRGIADIFVNLARRNQSLLDRQIEFIDGLEAQEQDPDQLENLFKLDHLATRMRRNAESLLVLAGAEPPRRRARPVELADVVRVAIGEVEDFTRINLLSLDDATVGGNAAVDLAHLLSELMENATQFSPPDSTVEVVGGRSPNGDYAITIADRGIGMSAEQLQEANALLSAPPPVGLALSRSLGFIVVGRLARRLRVSVRLNASPAGGITAVVELPAAVLAGQLDVDAGPAPAPPVDRVTTTDLGVEATPPPPPIIEDPRPLVVDGEPAPVPGAPASLSDALPLGEDFERGLAALVGPDTDPDAGPEDLHRSFWGELADDAPELPTDAPPAEPQGLFGPPPAPVEESQGLFGPPPATPEPPPPPSGGLFGPPPAPEQPTEAPPAWEPAPAWLEGDLSAVEPEAPAADAFAPPPPAPVEVPAAAVAPAAPPAVPEGPPPLARRQPRATLEGETERPRVSSTRRSPEEVRAMLSRYRRGLDDGRSAAPSTED